MLVFFVTVLLGKLNFIVKYANVFSVEDFDITSIKLRHLRIVELGRLIFKKAVALANTITTAVSWLVFTAAAQLTI